MASNISTIDMRFSDASMDTTNKLALVIGNGVYSQEKNHLDSPQHDAEEMAAALRTFGFDVIHRVNANHKTINALVNEFVDRIDFNDMVVFYFSGHGIQWQVRFSLSRYV